MNSKLLKRSILAAAVSMLSFASSQAFASYVYTGADLGVGLTHYNNSNLGLDTTHTSNTGIAGRIYTGYQFNPFWGTELGFTQFSDTKMKQIAGVDGLNGHISQFAIDLLSKASYPVNCSTAVFAKAGLAYVQSRASVSRDLGVDGSITVQGDKIHEYRPAFGLGVSYDITRQVPIELSWLRTQRVGDSRIRSTDFFSVGLGYKFG